jgi:hypothetical protein
MLADNACLGDTLVADENKEDAVSFLLRLEPGLHLYRLFLGHSSRVLLQNWVSQRAKGVVHLELLLLLLLLFSVPFGRQH